MLLCRCLTIFLAHLLTSYKSHLILFVLTLLPINFPFLSHPAPRRCCPPRIPMFFRYVLPYPIHPSTFNHRNRWLTFYRRLLATLQFPHTILQVQKVHCTLDFLYLCCKCNSHRPVCNTSRFRVPCYPHKV